MIVNTLSSTDVRDSTQPSHKTDFLPVLPSSMEVTWLETYLTGSVKSAMLHTAELLGQENQLDVPPIPCKASDTCQTLTTIVRFTGQ